MIYVTLKGFKLFGYTIVKEEDFNDASNNFLKQIQLDEKVKTQQEELAKKDDLIRSFESKSIFPFPITIADPTPTKASERKSYVTEVAGFHKNFLHSKLMHMIHKIHVVAESEDNSRDQDLMLKGAIYALRELDSWGTLMTNEALSYIEENKLTDNLKEHATHDN